ncbi:hypothetical protein [Enterobacter asburiae]|uniref:hypothetical protein n=1 Tax=Enterobacter asburiae TaxID=61645 RepID=UPI002A811D52|nr:hypothetical protein [Enterobacter asburiae]
MSVKRYSVWEDEMVEEKHAINSTNGMVHLMVKHEDYAALEARCAALAAENAGLKAEVPMGAIVNGRAFADRLEAYPFECQGGNLNMCSDWQELLRCFEHLSEWAMRGQPETPATDSFLAEVRAQARNEGINYAASRLAAAFNHGFVDKPLAEVLDVVHMIMDTKEELANSTLPAADGLSGEYAEKFLTEFAGYARKGEEPEEGQSFLSDEDCQAFVKAFTKGDAK